MKNYRMNNSKNARKLSQRFITQFGGDKKMAHAINATWQDGFVMGLFFATLFFSLILAARFGSLVFLFLPCILALFYYGIHNEYSRRLSVFKVSTPAQTPPQSPQGEA
jgi:hypothetical protein